MTRWTLLLAVVLAGCDALSDPGADYMVALEGDWTRTIAAETIAADGAVSTLGEPDVDSYSIATSQTCNREFVQSAGDRNRIALSVAPSGRRSCDVLATDGDAQRIILVGVVFDTAGNVLEDAADRHAWTFYEPVGDGVVIRRTWTLTR